MTDLRIISCHTLKGQPSPGGRLPLDLPCSSSPSAQAAAFHSFSTEPRTFRLRFYHALVSETGKRDQKQEKKILKQCFQEGMTNIYLMTATVVRNELACNPHRVLAQCSRYQCRSSLLSSSGTSQGHKRNLNYWRYQLVLSGTTQSNTSPKGYGLGPLHLRRASKQSSQKYPSALEWGKVVKSEQETWDFTT